MWRNFEVKHHDCRITYTFKKLRMHYERYRFKESLADEREEVNNLPNLLEKPVMTVDVKEHKSSREVPFTPSCPCKSMEEECFCHMCSSYYERDTPVEYYYYREYDLVVVCSERTHRVETFLDESAPPEITYTFTLCYTAPEASSDYLTAAYYNAISKVLWRRPTASSTLVTVLSKPNLFWRVVDRSSNSWLGDK